MKNTKLRTKLMDAFIVVALIGSLIGILGVVKIRSIRGRQI